MTRSLDITAAPKPVLCMLEPGRTWLWCRCGRSTTQHFCDGRSHIGSGVRPVGFRTAAGAEEVLLCGCKQTATPPYCDGTHANLPGGYGEDDRTEAERARIPWAARDAHGVARLDGGCHVVRADATRPLEAPAFWSRCLVSPATGSVHQSQFYGELSGGASPALGGGAGALIFWFVAGLADVTVSGRSFAVEPESALYVRPGEQAVLRAPEGEAVCFFVSACPAADSMVAGGPAAPFDADWPERVCRVDPEARCAAGPRYFQMLVDGRVGCDTAAQFIGHIPPSRAAMHRHLYEEVLIIMSGNGILWNEASRAEIAAGDMVFLPRKHPHSLESLGPAGMDVVGVIHPGSNPGISY